MDQKPKTYGVRHEGKIIGEIPNTGDDRVDAAATRQMLIDKGVYTPTTPFQSMFWQALSFCTTASYLYKKDLQVMSAGNHYSAIPFIVNAAFAIELYLKTLAAVHKKTLRGHELAKLFDALPVAAAAEIDAHCPAAAAGHKVAKGRSFRDCLVAMNTAFVDWRYLYEEESIESIRLNEVIFVLDAVHHACSAHDKAGPAKAV
jgi:hypothetical protein